MKRISAQEEYNNLIKIYKKLHKSCKRKTSILLFYLIVMLVCSLVFRLYLDILILLFLLAYYLNFKLNGVLAIHDKKISIVEHHNIEVLNDMLVNSSKKIGITNNKINIWKSYHSSYLPSIQEDVGVFLTLNYEKEINIFLPVNFFSMLFLNPKHAEALMVHELGHVKHGDSNLWLSVTFFNQTFKRLIAILYFVVFFIEIPFLVITYIEIFMGTDVISGIKENSWLLLILSFNVVKILVLDDISKRLSKELHFARKVSEKLADLIVVLHSDGKALIECFNIYFEKKEAKVKTSPHLPLDERIEYIEKFL